MAVVAGAVATVVFAFPAGAGAEDGDGKLWADPGGSALVSGKCAPDEYRHVGMMVHPNGDLNLIYDVVATAPDAEGYFEREVPIPTPTGPQPDWYMVRFICDDPEPPFVAVYIRKPASETTTTTMQDSTSTTTTVVVDDLNETTTTAVRRESGGSTATTLASGVATAPATPVVVDPAFTG
jgi:hypothetical protein